MQYSFTPDKFKGPQAMVCPTQGLFLTYKYRVWITLIRKGCLKHVLDGRG
jgi:hypothetical protein